MVKIIINKKKLTPLIAIVLFILLGAFNISSGIAIHMQGDGATFNLDKADPVGYGVYIPAPNMYTTMSISGSNQGEFVAMNWLGVPSQTETVDYPGNDISYAYPWYFENYIIKSTTDNDYINPWSVEWLNVSAYDAENDTLSPFTLNTVFNYYVMAEGSELTVPINNSLPMQIDIMIDNTGPKMLKFDFVIDDPEAFPINTFHLVSPSGKLVDFDFAPAVAYFLIGSGTVFYYMSFVSHEQGTYRLLIDADYAAGPAYINLEFLDFKLTNLAVNKVVYGSAGDDYPSGQDMMEDEWDAEWFKLSGKKGDKFTLDYGLGYTQIDPTADILVDIWSPCENGYNLESGILPGTYDIYFPKTGSVYISISDILTRGMYKPSLYVKEIPTIDYNIGDNVTNIRVSRDQRKAIDFTVEQDSFVRFNYTEWGEGDAEISSMGTTDGFIFKDAKNLECYEVLIPIETKSAGTMDFYYYYFPAGEYEAIIKNTDILYDSVLQISSEYVYYANSTVPITSLSYPLTNPTSSLTAQFQPDAFYSSLKQGQWFDINIAETGQYRLNWSIFASDNVAQIPTSANPSVVLAYNGTTEEYYDYTTISHTYLQSFPAFDTDDDFLYIAYPGKWHDMHFNMSQFGAAEGHVDLEVDVWHSDTWNRLDQDSDTTSDFTDNGTWVLDIYGDTDSDFEAWSKGVGTEFDLDGIDEDRYYWLRFDCEAPYSPMPYFDLISLSNITMHGDVNFALVGDSGYVYGDFWTPTAASSVTDFVINQDWGKDFDSREGWLFDDAISDPYILGLEAGNYKLLVIPEQWSHPGSLGIRFSIEDYWGYHVEQSYTIPGEPLAHTWQIGDFNVGDSILYNYSTYPYDFSITYNDTEVSWAQGGNEAYVAIKCYGKPYSWTQLVVGGLNVSTYDLYILQDLPWLISSNPYQEQMPIAGGIGDNNTIEFGVIRDNFTLLFEIQNLAGPNEMVTLNIGLRQYNTTALYGSEIIASYTPPGPDLGPLVVTLLIVIPSAIGVAVVVVYVVKKRKA